MPAVRKPHVVAIACADLHLSDKPPIARAGEPCWYKAMERPLWELSRLQAFHTCPVLCAGDIFHTWNSCPELINFAIRRLPDHMIAVPGQHDLPYHRYTDIQRSAYWNLVLAGKVSNLTQDALQSWECKGTSVTAHAFPWSFPLQERTTGGKGLHIAVCHQYIWSEGHCFPGVTMDNHAENQQLYLHGFDVAVFGDNHKGFCWAGDVRRGEPVLFNCGGFMRRNSDQVDYRPRVGLVMSNGDVVPHYLDTDADVIDGGVIDLPKGKFDASGFVEMLGSLGVNDFDFEVAVKQWIVQKRVCKATKELILQMLEDVK